MNRESHPARPRRTVLLAVGAVIAVLLLGVGLFWILGDDNGGGPPPPSPSKSASSSTCGLADGDQAVPTRAAPPTSWNLTHRMAVPSSKEIGPGQVEDGIHSCFARNPAGALFAVAHLSADPGNPDVDARELFAQRTVHDANYRAAMKETSSRGRENGGVQIAGYRITSYGRDQAQVVLAFRVSEGANTGSLVGTNYNMKWQDGDWKGLVPPPGAEVSTQLDSLDGFVEWSGV